MGSIYQVFEEMGPRKGGCVLRGTYLHDWAAKYRVEELLENRSEYVKRRPKKYFHIVEFQLGDVNEKP